MATFGEMQTYVSARLIDPQNTAVGASSVADAINESIRYWKLRRFGFNEAKDTVPLTLNDPIIPLPTDFLVPFSDDDGFYIEYSGVRYPLRKITQQQYDNLYLTNGYGLPRWYARSGDGNYLLYPIPNVAYDIGRHYMKEYPPLVADSDTNDFTDNAARLIELWTLANLQGELRQDEKMEAYYRKAANDEYRQLRVLSDKQNGTGKLTLYSNLTTLY